jgi:hypothetical protein
MEQRRFVVHFAFEVGATFNQSPEHIEVSGLNGPEYGTHSEWISRMNIRTPANEKLRHGEVSSLCHPAQTGRAENVFGIDISTVVQQERGDFLRSLKTGHGQRCPAVIVFYIGFGSLSD